MPNKQLPFKVRIFQALGDVALDRVIGQLPDDFALQVSSKLDVQWTDVNREIPPNVIEGAPGRWFLTETGLVLVEIAAQVRE